MTDNHRKAMDRIRASNAEAMRRREAPPPMSEEARMTNPEAQALREKRARETLAPYVPETARAKLRHGDLQFADNVTAWGAVQAMLSFAALPQHEPAREHGDGREHVLTQRSEGMIDFADCSCGWSSGPYFDGDVYAKEAWEKHTATRPIDAPKAGGESYQVDEAGLFCKHCGRTHIRHHYVSGVGFLCEGTDGDSLLQDAISRIEDMLSGDDGQAFKEARKSLPRLRAGLAKAGKDAVLREALCVVRGSVGDLRKGFAKSVDPARWADQVIAHIDAALTNAGGDYVTALTPHEPGEGEAR